MYIFRTAAILLLHIRRKHTEKFFIFFWRSVTIQFFIITWLFGGTSGISVLEIYTIPCWH